MNRPQKLLSAALAALMLAQPLSALALTSAERAARQQDLDTLVTTLEEKHKDMYRNVTREAVAKKQAEISQNLEQWDDFEFSLELQSLVAMLKDSHTSMSLNASSIRALPLAIQWMDGAWRLTAAPEAQKALLGQEVTRMGKLTVSEVEQKLSAFISADNDVKRRYSFEQYLNIWELLTHFGIADASATGLDLTVRDAAGAETTFTLTPMTQETLQASKLATLAQQAEKAAPTARDRSVVYKLSKLNYNTLYIQYNQCREDEKLPMQQFGAQVADALNTGDYGRIIIDLRYNGGGSDGVIWGMMEPILAAQQRGVQLDVLIGSATFSSALINAVQLKQIGATLYGTETGGSVSHFGEVGSFTLPNSKLTIGYSSNYFDLSGYYAAAKPYGVEPLKPDVTVSQTIADFLEGRDTVVMQAMSKPVPAPQKTLPALPSSTRLTLDGKALTLPAYLIADENYVALRDFAALLSGTGKQFNLNWHEAENYIEILADTAYVPVGSELAALPQGAQAASPSAVGLAMSDGMPLQLLGDVGAVRVFEVAGRNYLRLRDLGGKLGVGVSWEQETQTVTLTTK